MASALPTPSPPMPLLETLLRLAPLDVLLFDTDLVCRYAALADGTLLGRTVEQLIGEPADAIFGAEAGDLLSALREAAQDAGSYQYPSYRYTFGDAETQTLYCWSIRIQPVLLLDYRGREEFRGVVVTLADVQDLVDERDRLREAEQRLLIENGVLHAETEELQAQRRALIAGRYAIQTQVRSLLAPVYGYLQALAQRPGVLGGETIETLVERELLPRLRDVVAAVDEAAAGADRPPSGSTS
jgi:hypothetical protein